MVKSRPQLNLTELHQLRWLLGSLLGLVALTSVLYLEVEALLLLGAAMTTGLATLVRPTLPARVPGWFHKLAFPISLSAFVFDIYTFGQPMSALVRLGVLLLWYRLATYRRRRDDLQLAVLGLFLIVAAGVLTISIAFAAQIVVFVGLALGLLFVRTLVDAIEPAGAGLVQPGEVPAWAQVRWVPLFRRLREVIDWRLGLFAAGLFGGLVVLSAVLFMAIPRFELENSLFLDRWMNKRSVTGFTDTLRFGEVSDIQEDNSIVLRVDVSDREEVPTEIYWRMVVLDEYRDHTFRMSAAVKQEAFGSDRARTDLQMLDLSSSAGRASWTFYMEPGVSRYLPILGGFANLRFTEPQNVRVSESLRMIMLTRDPARMKAYRVDRMSSGETLRTPRHSEQRLSSTVLEVPFSAAEREQWQRAVQEITGGVEMPPREFASRAMTWLHERHTYSLTNVLPPGEGDPLVRWAMSTEPGHCELFAGSFAMLARSAGIPARVVGGFMGGTWNGDHLNVRASNAHAWCEIHLGGGVWLRVDPTAPAPGTSESAAQVLERLRSRVTEESGLSARLDRVRMFWYRRVVQFDRADQTSLVRSLQERTQSSGQWMRQWMQTQSSRLQGWLRRPWDFSRFLNVGLAAAAVAGVGYFWVRHGRGWWRKSLFTRGGGDPVRREAGIWLRRIADKVEAAPQDAEFEATKALLQRLRYGRWENRPDPKAVFDRARRLLRGQRRPRALSDR